MKFVDQSQQLGVNIVPPVFAVVIHKYQAGCQKPKSRQCVEIIAFGSLCHLLWLMLAVIEMALKLKKA